LPAQRRKPRDDRRHPVAPCSPATCPQPTWRKLLKAISPGFNWVKIRSGGRVADRRCLPQSGRNPGKRGGRFGAKIACPKHQPARGKPAPQEMSSHERNQRAADDVAWVMGEDGDAAD